MIWFRRGTLFELKYIKSGFVPKLDGNVGPWQLAMQCAKYFADCKTMTNILFYFQHRN